MVAIAAIVLLGSAGKGRIYLPRQVNPAGVPVDRVCGQRGAAPIDISGPAYWYNGALGPEGFMLCCSPGRTNRW